MRRHGGIALSLMWAALLAGCSTPGVLSGGIPYPAVSAAYIPLATTNLVIFSHWGAGVVVAPGIAATNAHNANLVAKDDILAVSTNYDLLFFRAKQQAAISTAAAFPGEAVIAYGQDGAGHLREASGKVLKLDVPVDARCPTCGEQFALTFDADAGKGFSGGPVVDAQSGAMIGMTFGYRPDAGRDGGPLMYAYGADLIVSEMHDLLGQKSKQ